MASLLYNYFSQGQKHFEIKFTSFVLLFIKRLEGDDMSQRKLAFTLLDDNQNGEISVSELIRVYIGLPKYCQFAGEIRHIFQFYMENFMKHRAVFKRSAKFDIYDYAKMVPESGLKLELHEIFVYRVKYYMNVKVNYLKTSENLSDNLYDINRYNILYEGVNDSVFFDHGIPEKKNNEDDQYDKFYD